MDETEDNHLSYYVYNTQMILKCAILRNIALLSSIQTRLCLSHWTMQYHVYYAMLFNMWCILNKAYNHDALCIISMSQYAYVIQLCAASLEINLQNCFINV